MKSSLGLLTHVRWALKCPQYYLLRLVSAPGSPREIRFHLERSISGLSQILEVPRSAIESWFEDVARNANLRRVEKQVHLLPYSGVFRGGPELYVILRATVPKVVVETGVGLGYSSAYILEALNENDTGRLISIDLPNADAGWKLPDGSGPGSLVPADRRKRWELRFGSTRQLLPSVLKELGNVDLFFHDSEHTYDTMMFEYRHALEALSPAGMIVSDDAMWNTAMIDFARAAHLKIEFVYHRGGSAPFTLTRLGPRRRRSSS
ncbi:MAG TPA: class I SAM-dependent methyltransferase [Thermoplasmata archaeon]|nr:class I SAM-dependent methyltransferase [Thermoplasmata archaeon]